MISQIKLPVFAALACSAVACATLVNDSPQTVPITSDPPGATITIDGVNQGVTPLRAKLPVKGNHEVTVEAKGYPARTVAVKKSIGVGYVVLDILFGLVPLAVDLYTGDLYNLSPGKLHFQFAALPEPKAKPKSKAKPRMPWPDRMNRSNRNSRKQPGSDSTGGAKASAHCCVNGAYYSCPDAAAVAQCAPPQLASCLMNCGMTDSQCPEQCLAKYGPDPSSCSREPAQDNTCKR